MLYLTILVSTGLLLLAFILYFKVKNQPYVSPYRVLIYLTLLASIYVAAGLGLQIYAMNVGNQWGPALKAFAEKYPTVLAEDLASVISPVEGSSYWMGFGRGLLVGAAAPLIIILPVMKRLLKPVQTAKPVKEVEKE